MAASHSGRVGSQSDQFSGSQETSAPLPLSLSSHLFGLDEAAPDPAAL